MKKFFLIVLVFVISLCSYNFVSIDVKAAEDSITDEEIIELTTKSYELFCIIYHDASKYIDYEGEPVYLERNGYTAKYLPAKEGMTDYSYWENLARSYYTDDLYQYAVEHGRGTDYVQGMLINHEGKAYFLDNTPIDWQPILYGYTIYGYDINSITIGSSYEDGTTVWMEKRESDKAFGYITLYSATEKYQGAPVTLPLSISFIKTENGWRISGGAFVDLFCPSHTGVRSSRPQKYFKYYTLLYTQIAESRIKAALKEYFESDIMLSSLKIVSSGYYYEHIKTDDGRLCFSEQGTYDAEVLVSAEGLFDNKPFIIRLKSDTLGEDWKADVMSIEIDGKNPFTGDNALSVLTIFSVIILCASAALKCIYLRKKYLTAIL